MSTILGWYLAGLLTIPAVTVGALAVVVGATWTLDLWRLAVSAWRTRQMKRRLRAALRGTS
jgi:hypothetical protein